MRDEERRTRHKDYSRGFVRGARTVAENARKWWAVPSDDSGHSLDDWLNAVEEWAASDNIYAEIPLFPGEKTVAEVVEHLQEEAAKLFPGLPYCELRRFAQDPGKFWLHFESKHADQRDFITMVVRVEFSDSDFVGLNREEAVSHVHERVLSRILEACGGPAGVLREARARALSR